MASVPINYEAAGNHRPFLFDLAGLEQNSLDTPGEALQKEYKRLCELAVVQKLCLMARQEQWAGPDVPEALLLARAVNFIEDRVMTVFRRSESITRVGKKERSLATELLGLPAGAQLMVIWETFERRNQYIETLQSARRHNLSVGARLAQQELVGLQFVEHRWEPWDGPAQGLIDIAELPSDETPGLN